MPLYLQAPLLSFRWGCLLLLVASVSPACCNAAAESGALVRSIEITGNNLTEPDAVRSGLAFRPGERLTPFVIDQSIKKLFATGQFADVRIKDTGGGNVLVEVAENPRIAGIAFEGNSALDHQKLAAAIALKRGDFYTRARAHGDETRIRDLYRRQGHHQTAVAASTKEAARGGVDLVFKIDEGKINKIEGIEFAGNRAFKASRLRDVISTTQSGWLDLLKGAATYDRDQLASDRALLREFYNKHGYADATVAEPVVEKLTETGNFRITFAVDEGDLFAFGAQRVESKLTGVDGKGLQSLIEAEDGHTYDKSKIDRSVTSISLKLAEDGKPFARVTPKQQRDDGRRTISVAYVIDQGPQVYIRRIEISGNDRTRDYVIRRELKLAEGDAYSLVLIEASRKQLLRTGFFKKVELTPERTAERERVDLRVSLVEQETGELSFGLGYSQNDGIIGDVSYSERNLLGTGLSAKVKLELGEKRYGAEIGFTNPRFLGSNLNAGFDMFFRDTDRTLQSSYKEQRWGGAIRLGIPITDTLATGLNYTFTRSTIHDVGANASTAIKEAVPGYPNATTSTYDTSSIGYVTAYDTRDSKKLPTTGVYSSVKQDFAGVGGDAAFVRSVVDVRGYYPVVDGIVLGGHLGAGYINGYAGQDVRLLDLFYRGSETVRGFATSGIGPRDSASANQDALGGKMYYTSSLEARTAIPFVPSELGLNAIGFVDAGSLFSPNKTASALPGLTGNSAAPRVSTGTGLVWDSPLGPLQATYGFVLSQQPGDKTQPFNFGLGSNF